MQVSATPAWVDNYIVIFPLAFRPYANPYQVVGDSASAFAREMRSSVK